MFFVIDIFWVTFGISDLSIISVHPPLLVCQLEASQVYEASYHEYRKTVHLFVVAAMNTVYPMNIYVLCVQWMYMHMVS